MSRAVRIHAEDFPAVVGAVQTVSNGTVAYPSGERVPAELLDNGDVIFLSGRDWQEAPHKMALTYEEDE